MNVNGELKLILGAALITVNYAIYMICTPDPADGMVLAGIVGAISALIGGVATKAILYRKLKTND